MQVADKKALRKHFKEIRGNMDLAERTNADNNIAQLFLQTQEYIDCRDILVYVSSEIEVSTRKIMETAFLEKNVYCPRCVSGTNIMNFYRVSDFSQLEKGSFGILEPDKDCELRSSFDKRAVCVVPALSFDKNGYRLGFGKGFYDRYLADFSGIKIGLCYENCLSGIRPSDSFDIVVNKVVTEKSIYFLKG